MRRTIVRIDGNMPVVQVDGPQLHQIHLGVSTEQFRIFLQQTYDRGLIIGTGSPDAVVEAQQGQEYMDDAGSAGSVKWIKQLADIGGDRKLGWVPIG